MHHPALESKSISELIGHCHIGGMGHCGIGECVELAYMTEELEHGGVAGGDFGEANFGVA